MLYLAEVEVQVELHSLACLTSVLAQGSGTLIEHFVLALG